MQGQVRRSLSDRCSSSRRGGARAPSGPFGASDLHSFGNFDHGRPIGIGQSGPNHRQSSQECVRFRPVQAHSRDSCIGMRVIFEGRFEVLGQDLKVVGLRDGFAVPHPRANDVGRIIHGGKELASCRG